VYLAFGKYLVIVGRNSKVLLIVPGCQKISLIKGYFMNLFVAWQDSLTILQPKNLKLFLLVTLKAMGDTFKPWIKYFWWLLLIEFAMPRLWLTLYGTTSFFSNMWLNMAATNFTSMLWFVSILLAARPSVAIKNCAYFRSYIWRIVYVLPISLLINMGTSFLMYSVFDQYINISLSPTVVGAVLIMGIINWSVRIYVINYALFVLDSDASIKQVLKSLLYALKMVVYNYPFYIIVYIVHGLINAGKYLLFLQITKWYYSFVGMENMASGAIGLLVIRYSDMLVFAILIFFLYCFLTNFYIKKLHDQFTLYFGKNE